MRNNREKTVYTEQKLSRWADSKIRMRLFRVYVKKQLQAGGFAISSKMLAGVLAVALIVVFIAPSWEQAGVERFVAQAEASQQALEERKQRDIYHHKLVVSEGKDKAAYVAYKKDVPLSEAETVPLRHDTVLEWEHGITNLSYIETDVAARPIEVRLNLENDDHMHIFAYEPESCDTQERDGYVSESCVKEEIVTQEYVAHRTLFDEVHDIETLYEDEVAYLPEREPVAISTLEFVDRTDRYYVFAKRDGVVEQRYFFDRDTHYLDKQVTTIIEEGKRYEMSVVEVTERTFLEPQEADELFDPDAYAYQQLEVIPI